MLKLIEHNDIGDAVAEVSKTLSNSTFYIAQNKKAFEK
jgi:hypothetical protein